MWISKRKFKAAKEAAAKEALEQLVVAVKKQNDHQEKMAEAFDVHTCNDITMNIWDDYEDGGTTMAIIESIEVPNTVAKEILLHTLSYVRKPLKDLGVIAQIEHVDPFRAYPNLISKPDSWIMANIRWQLSLQGIKKDIKGQVVEIFRNAPCYQRVNMKVISES